MDCYLFSSLSKGIGLCLNSLTLNLLIEVWGIFYQISVLTINDETLFTVSLLFVGVSLGKEVDSFR